jgi:soluble lytic murein transglycosylase-like protein
MKTMLIAGWLLLFLGMSSIVYADIRKSKKVVINMKAIQIIESSGNAGAYNRRTKATGLYQITPICLADYNQFHDHKFKQNDLFNPDINFSIADWYIGERIPQLFKHYHIEDSVENRIIAWNAGIKYLLESYPSVPSETVKFIRRYWRLVDEHKNIVG